MTFHHEGIRGRFTQTTEKCGDRVHPELQRRISVIFIRFSRNLALPQSREPFIIHFALDLDDKFHGEFPFLRDMYTHIIINNGYQPYEIGLVLAGH